MPKLGLVTGSVTPSARAAPRTNVVLPAPSSPRTSTTSPGRRRSASCAPIASVSCGPFVSTRLAPGGAWGSGGSCISRAHTQREADKQQGPADDDQRRHVGAGEGELLGVR